MLRDAHTEIQVVLLETGPATGAAGQLGHALLQDAVAQGKPAHSVPLCPPSPHRPREPRPRLSPSRCRQRARHRVGDPAAVGQAHGGKLGAGSEPVRSRAGGRRGGRGAAGSGGDCVVAAVPQREAQVRWPLPKAGSQRGSPRCPWGSCAPTSGRWRRHGDAEPASAGLPLGFRNPIFDVMVFKQQVRRRREEALGVPLELVLGTASP